MCTGERGVGWDLGEMGGEWEDGEREECLGEKGGCEECARFLSSPK